jgi:sodium/proline symporter
MALVKAGPEYNSWTRGTGGFMAGVVIVGGFSWFFGYLGGQPQLSTRFMAIKSKKQARQARNVGIIWTVVAYTGALALGWIGIAIFGPNGLEDQEHVMPAVIMKIFHPLVAAVLMTGAIAAMTSTANSLLILSATELSENLIKPMNKKSSRGGSLFQSRMITAILAVVALALAYVIPKETIFTLVSYVWAGIGGTFSVVILLSLFWKKYHGMAVIATIVSGVTFTIIWISTGMEEHITSRLLTFFVAGFVAIATTYLWPKKV